MLIVFIGPPGAGKGTQAAHLVDYLHVPHLSTGEILRQAKRNGTPLGKKAASYMDQGHLVPDEVVVGVVGQRLEQPDCQHGCVLDGFPRTLPQAEALDGILAEHGHHIDLVLELQVDEDELVERLLERARQAERPRADDTPEAIPRRMEIYHEQTEPLLQYYRRRGALSPIDGVGTPQEVFERIKSCIEARQGNS